MRNLFDQATARIRKIAKYIPGICRNLEQSPEKTVKLSKTSIEMIVNLFQGEILHASILISRSSTFPQGIGRSAVGTLVYLMMSKM